MIRGPYKVHSARVVLNRHGITLSVLAEAANLTPGGVGRQLSGECRISPNVQNAMMSLIGADGAAEVLTVIPREQEAKAA